MNMGDDLILMLTSPIGEYRRGRDGRVVVAVEWHDGDISWMLKTVPLIWQGTVAGTCKMKTFLENHIKI